MTTIKGPVAFHAASGYLGSDTWEDADGKTIPGDVIAEHLDASEELALLRYHFDLQYSAVLQSVDLVEEHATQVREAARKVRDWRDAHPESEVRSDG